MNPDDPVIRPAARGPFLRVLEGPMAGAILDLADTDEVTIGGDGADRIVVPGRTGSLCRLRASGGRLHVEDLTGQGVLVNHRRGTEAPLTDGDLIVAGDAVLIYLEDCSGQQPRAMALDAGRITSLALIEIPRLFHSVYEGGPFRQCLMCSRPILDAPGQYYVEKVFRGSEVILECAICLACMQGMQSEFSQESKERLEAFGRDLGGTAHSLARCDVCKKPRISIAEFNLICGCIGSWMIQEAIFLLCDECVQKIQALLSKKTRDVHGDFLDDHFPGVPHDLDVPSPMLL